LQEKKIEGGPTLNTQNFHSSRGKMTKWARMEPICFYLNIYRHILRSYLHNNENKRKKEVLQTYNWPCNQSQQIEAYPKGAHCILMLILQICSTSISRSPQDFFKLKKNALIAITPTPPNLNLSP
jgi:hypothetical protein